MASMTSTLTVRLIDAVTGPARAAANSIRGIGRAVDQTNGRRLAIAGAVNTMTRDVTRATRDLSRNVQRVGSGFGMPTGLATWFGARSVYDFEKTSNALQAVTMMTEEQRKSIQGLAKDLNASFPFTNAEIMTAAFELGRAGLKFEQIKGALRDTLNLGLAGDIDLQQSADIATNVLTAMRLPMKGIEDTAESLRRVNDALSYAAANSNTDVRMMGETFKYVGPMAAAAGMSIEHVAAASMVMARNGIRASEAGVAMRSALVRMVRPTKPMLAALARLNVNVNDFVKSGRQISAQDIIGSLAADGIDAAGFATQIEAALKDPKLKNSLSGLTARLADIIGGDGSIMDKAKLAETISDTLTAAGSEVDLFGFIKALREKGADLGDIARIFDARQGARLITLLSGDLLGELEKVQANAPGATDEMARIRMQGVVGDVAALVAAFENLFLAIAEAGVLKAATDVIKAVTSALKTMAEASPTLLRFGTYALMAAGALAPLGFLLGGVVGLFGMMGSALRIIWSYGEGAIRVFRAAAGLGTAAAAAGAGGAAAGTAAGAGAAAGVASKGSKLLRGLGWLGLAITANEVIGGVFGKIDEIGKASNDAWTPKDPHAMADLLARQAEIDARLKQIDANMHPAMRDAPNPERDRLLMDRNMLQHRIDSAAPQAEPEKAAAAASETMAAFERTMEQSFATMKQKAAAHMAEMLGIMSISPVITPRISGAGLRGVHADIGVE